MIIIINEHSKEHSLKKSPINYLQMLIEKIYILYYKIIKYLIICDLFLICICFLPVCQDGCVDVCVSGSFVFFCWPSSYRKDKVCQTLMMMLSNHMKQGHIFVIPDPIHAAAVLKSQAHQHVLKPFNKLKCMKSKCLQWYSNSREKQHKCVCDAS